MKKEKPLILRTGDPERPWVVKIDDETIGYLKPRLIHEAIMPDGAVVDQHFNGRYSAANHLKALHEMTGSWAITLTIQGQESVYLFAGREIGKAGVPVPARWKSDRTICKQFRSNEAARQYARDHLHKDDLSGGDLSYEWASDAPTHVTTKARIKSGIAESGAKVYHVIDVETGEDMLDGEGFADEMDAANYIEESGWEQVN